MSYGGLGILATHFGEDLLADQLRKQRPGQPKKVEDELDVDISPCFLQARHTDGNLRVDASGWGRQPIKRVEGGGSQDCLHGINVGQLVAVKRKRETIEDASYEASEAHLRSSWDF